MRHFTIPLKKTKPTNFFIAGDWHYDHLHMPSYQSLKKVAMMVPKHQRRLIINGDFFDAKDFYKKDPLYVVRRKCPIGQDELLESYENEIQWGNEVLDDLSTVFNEIYFILGNHGKRFEHYRETFCADGYKHNYNIPESLKLKKRKIPYIDYRGWINIGKNTIVTHGEFHGATCHKKHYEVYGGKNVFFSHIHSYQVKAFHCKNQTRYSISLPAMCDLDAPYLEGAAQNWENGFLQVIAYKDHFQTYPHLIIGNKHFSQDLK